ncbi:acidic mammalian chitinase-like [Periplaneta americana]|uniref:acidic mammalian chitinase-like n=1 Tax=Periplaneta americana TaxID=6978 RepID=UPI0037E81F4E
MNCLLSYLLLLVTYFIIAELNAYRIVCYYQSWAIYRPSKGLFNIADIDSSLCTHHVYAFAGVNSNGDVTIGDSYADIDLGGFSKFNAMRNQNPSIKTMIAIGGAGASSQTFSKVINDPNKRNAFANNIVNFVQKYGFNGADIDWEYPAAFGGPASDKSAFVELVKQLRSLFNQHGYILSAAVSAGVDTIDPGYDAPGLSQYLDFINVMTYDMHGSWESKTGENSPLYAGPSDTSDFERTLNVDYAMKYWIKKGAPASKLNLGMGSYGNTFTLQSSSNNGVGAPSTGPGKAGPYTQGAGVLAYNEICEQHNAGQWTQYWNADQKCIYASNGNQWVGFDNIAAVKIKAQYIKNNGLGGAMIWSIDMDDFRNTCGDGKYPLLNTIKTYIA